MRRIHPRSSDRWKMWKVSHPNPMTVNSATAQQPPVQSTGPLEVAIAILYQGDQILMQLRDNIPTIAHPGVWGLFGGHLEVGETPETALRRELAEEISYIAATLTLFGQYRDPGVVRHVFAGPLTVCVEQLVLQEGWDLGLLAPESIRQGHHYSAKAQQVRPLGRPHQHILLDFLHQRQCESPSHSSNPGN